MARSSQRRFFPAVTTVVVILAAFGALSLVLRRAIPPPPPNRLADSAGDYLTAGSRQFVQWYPLGPEAFAESKRLDRPLFIAIGAQWSSAARQADATSFLNQDVVERLRQGYVCVRVDTDQYPEWLNAYLPLSRAVISDLPERQLWFEPSFQGIVLDPSELMVSWILRHFSSERMEPPFFLGGFTEANARIAGAAQLKPGFPAPGQVQVTDWTPLTSRQRPAKLDLETHMDWLRGHISSRFGGQPMNGFQLLQPNVWRFMLEKGELADLERSLGPALRSGIVDWLDGGFFRIADDPSWQQIEFDKLAVQNAEMMALLARIARTTNDPFCLALAKRTFDCLTGPFEKDGLVYGYRTVETTQDRRSQRDSFPPQELRDNFNAGDREWLRAHLGLKVESNPQMIATVPEPADYVVNQERYKGFFDRLRRIKTEAAVQYGSYALLDVNGFVCARLLETARLLEDPKRLATAAEIFDKLAQFRVGLDDVVHGLEDSARAYYYLGDYLAYADAALEHYRSFGIQRPLKDGLAVLKRALFLFHGDHDGVLLNGTMIGLAIAPPNAKSPEIVDNLRESTLAMAARLAFSYGAILKDDQLKGEARAILGQYASTANSIQNCVSGLFCADWLIQRDRIALITHRDGDAESLRSMERMAAKHPNDLVACSVESGSDGWFIFKGGKLVAGAVSDESADKLLSEP